MILKLNKYLKELGIDEHNWLFNKETILNLMIDINQMKMVLSMLSILI